MGGVYVHYDTQLLASLGRGSSSDSVATTSINIAYIVQLHHLLLSKSISPLFAGSCVFMLVRSARVCRAQYYLSAGVLVKAECGADITPICGS